MRLITCSRCQSQFDVSSMTPGTSFVCGKCRNVMQVPEAGPVVQPISAGRTTSAAPPPTVSMTPDQVRKALQASKEIQSERAATRPAPAERKLPKAMQQRAQQSAQQSSQRAGGPPAAAAPAQTPAGRKPAAKRPAAQKVAAQRPAATKASPAKASPAQASASSRSARTSRGGGGGGSEKKKSQGGLFAGISVGVVVLGLAAFVFLKGGADGNAGGNSGDEATATGPTAGDGTDPGTGTDTGTDTDGSGGAAATSGSSDVADTPNDEISQFLALGSQAQMDEVGKRVAAVQSDMNGLKVLYEHFSGERFAGASSAKKAVELIATAALRIDADSDWANEASGKKNLRDLLAACIEECPKSFEFSEDAEIAVQNRHSELADASPWVDAKEFREFEAKVKHIREREASLASDDRLVQVEKQKDWVRKNDLFRDLNIVARFEEPYVIFQQWDKMEAGKERYESQRREKANLFAKRDGVVFRELNHQFRNLFGERFKLPELKEKGRLLRVLILWNREMFDEWHRRQKTGMPAGIRAYYSPGERHIVHYVGTDAMTDQDVTPCANDRVQKMSDQVTFHEGTHQLMHEYAAIHQGHPLPSDPAAEAPVPPRKSMWFDEGLAEFMGAVEVDKAHVDLLDGPFYHNRILLERVAQAHAWRAQGAKMWPLGKMLLPNNNGDLMRMAEELMPGQSNLSANLFYAQSWAFVHFCWWYDNGKYRSKLLDYMGRVLDDSHGTDTLVKVFGLPSADDFGIVGKEFDWYWNLLLRCKVGQKRGQPGQYWYPETDPPTELYDPNAEGGGDYDE